MPRGITCRAWREALLVLRKKGLKRRSSRPVELKSSDRAHSEEEAGEEEEKQEHLQKAPSRAKLRRAAAFSALLLQHPKYSDTGDRKERMKRIRSAMVPTTLSRFASWEWAASTERSSLALRRV